MEVITCLGAVMVDEELYDPDLDVKRPTFTFVFNSQAYGRSIRIMVITQN